MAIIIPSKNTYDRQNPKVRDNVIERIEVGAVEIVPNNKYEEPVYNVAIYSGFYKVEEVKEMVGDVALIGGSGIYQSYNNAISYLSTTARYNKTTIKIPLVKDNHYINSLLLGVDENKNANIKYTVSGIIKTGIVEATLTRNGLDDEDLEIGEIKEAGEVSKQGIFEIKSKIDNPIEYGGTAVKAEANAVIEVEEGNIKETSFSETKIITENGIEYYILSLTFLCAVDNVKIGGKGIYQLSETIDYDGIGTYEKYEPQELEITIYGNTIGIDLTDKTVYINGETQKKVHSVDGNELMQTSNYIKDENENITENAIGTMYGKTRKEYERGKETATIRCSISDYYDGDQKVIAIDNSTGKMSFDIGDKVIPMVYGADGKDRPISTYQNGLAKEFEVLGTKKFYDGAVWQELSLQEV